MIAPRVALRHVQHRILALRRAVLHEVEDTNRLIYHVLRGGVVVSVSLLLYGLILSGVTQQPVPSQAVPLRSLLPELYRFTPAGYLSLGVLVLIVTPMARVFLSLLSFLEDREGTYVLVTAIVFANLVFSVFLIG